MGTTERAPTHARITVGPVTLHIARWHGDGPPLLLLPAMTQTWEAWLPVVPAFAAHFDVVAADLRGHGQSDKPAAGYHLADYAADVVALTHALGWTKPVVIGHSLGGSVARVAAARTPNWARRIVIEDTPPHLDRPDPRVVLLAKGYLKMGAMPPEQVATHYRRVHPVWSDAHIQAATEAAMATDPGVLHTYLAADAPLTIAESIAAITCPVLLVYGDTKSGGFVSDADAQVYLDALPHGRAVQIPGAGHSLHARKPADFLATVLPFLLTP